DRVADRGSVQFSDGGGDPDSGSPPPSLTPSLHFTMALAGNCPRALYGAIATNWKSDVGSASKVEELLVFCQDGGYTKVLLRSSLPRSSLIMAPGSVDSAFFAAAATACRPVYSVACDCRTEMGPAFCNAAMNSFQPGPDSAPAICGFAAKTTTFALSGAAMAFHGLVCATGESPMVGMLFMPASVRAAKIYDVSAVYDST